MTPAIKTRLENKYSINIWNYTTFSGESYTCSFDIIKNNSKYQVVVKRRESLQQAIERVLKIKY